METANSFSKKREAYAYLDGIQEWNEIMIKKFSYRTKRSYLIINYVEQWGIINLKYTIKKRK